MHSVTMNSIYSNLSIEKDNRGLKSGGSAEDFKVHR